jgi:hypothetical protein
MNLLDIHLQKPHIRHSTYYMLAIVVIVLNIINFDSSLGQYNGTRPIPVMSTIAECFASILGYIALRILISNFTIGGSSN